MNLNIKLSLSYLLVLFSIVFTSCSSGPVNLQTAKSEVQNYYESDKYSNDLKEIISSAENQINNVKLNNNSAVVFDVDETTLLNYEAIKKVNFGYVESMWSDWINEAKAPAIPEIKKLYDFVVSKNITVIFITGRDDTQYDVTYKNLKTVGYTKFDTLILKNKSSQITTGKFKSDKREELSAKGYEIIASVGDQESDFEGKYCGIKVKLPNYLYLIK